MIVPRGTEVQDGRNVYLRSLPGPWRAAVLRGLKSEIRIPLTAANSTVHPGKFSGLDLETGRARWRDTPELRASCSFPNGSSRAVTVRPLWRRGDFLCVPPPSARTALSRLTLEVTGVRVARLRDMTDPDALAEGVACLPFGLRTFIGVDRPVEWFAMYWDKLHGHGSWRANPWCWVVAFQVHRENYSRVMDRLRAKK